MIQTSEWVSPGHPDKVADAISSTILDHCLAADPATRFAVECQIKDNFVNLGGEVTTNAILAECDLKRLTRKAIEDIGYTREYQRKWGYGNTIDPDNLHLFALIGKQSPDISQGVDRDGWGDQGIFWGMATGEREYGFMPRDYWYARALGTRLYTLARLGKLPIGLDIKTQVEVNDGQPASVIVAAPTRDASDTEELHEAVWRFFWDRCGVNCLPPEKIIVNGTGRYVRHASQGDCGTTGRKLAVDFYGGNCRIGGGSPWTKDPSKADLTLNLYARKLALEYVLARNESSVDCVYVSISCCIGQPAIRITYYDAENNQLETRIEVRPAREIIAELELRQPVYEQLCNAGLFSLVDKSVAGIEPFSPSLAGVAENVP